MGLVNIFKKISHLILSLRENIDLGPTPQYIGYNWRGSNFLEVSIQNKKDRIKFLLFRTAQSYIEEGIVDDKIEEVPSSQWGPRAYYYINEEDEINAALKLIKLSLEYLFQKKKLNPTT
jgi:predicted transport protein